ncbi:heparan-sulfate 6-O-sulfotransferase 2 [Bombina bombina]|uniref:heparan-sulfate 6-O-sulfotransferase 2 n=1 Tax=Bombina bombina TaxID=8345 RepID=UPI00235AE7B3|nr:heparan-sulfate 6-O-sulfotransferase 2 [Bombina bombina]
MNHASLSGSLMEDSGRQYGQIVNVIKKHLPILRGDNDLHDLVKKGCCFVPKCNGTLGNYLSPSMVNAKEPHCIHSPSSLNMMNKANTARNFYYITILRDPVSRYLSEWRHVQRGATWKASLHVCDGRSPTSNELPSCYTGDDWSGCSLKEFMDCPYNLANNRQVRMLSDLSLVGCYNLSVMPEDQRNKVLLDSAKENLKQMAFFGLTEFQRKTQYLFEKTFNMHFISPFTQFNSTRASSVEIDDQTQKRIETLNFLDMELYEYAKDLFLQRYQFMRQKEHQEARRKRQEQRKIFRSRHANHKEETDNSTTDYIGNVEKWR